MAEGVAAGASAGAVLNDIRLLAGGEDADPEAREIIVPDEVVARLRLDVKSQ